MFQVMDDNEKLAESNKNTEESNKSQGKSNDSIVKVDTEVHLGSVRRFFNAKLGGPIDPRILRWKKTIIKSQQKFG